MDEFPCYGERDRDSSRSVDLVVAARRFRRYSSGYPSNTEVTEAARPRNNSQGCVDRSTTGFDSQMSGWNSQASTPRPVSFEGHPRHISLQFHCQKAMSEPMLPEEFRTLSHPEIEPVPSPPPPSAPVGPPEIRFSTIHEIAFIATVCFSQLLSLASLAQTVAPLLIIGKDLGVSNPAELAWFTASYSMSLGTFIMPAGTNCTFTICVLDVLTHSRTDRRHHRPQESLSYWLVMARILVDGSWLQLCVGPDHA